MLLVVGIVLIRRRHDRRNAHPAETSRVFAAVNNHMFIKENLIHSVDSDGLKSTDYINVAADGEQVDGFSFPSDDVTAPKHSANPVAKRSSIGADADLLPPEWRSLPTEYFKQEEPFPQVLLSYQSHSTGENVGKAWMWAVANGFRAANVTSFNGYQVCSRP